MQKHDILIVSELSRLGRSLMEVMSILHTLMEKNGLFAKFEASALD
jgi:putative DNA-invertase from lambdoid prophage Rac